MRWLAVAMVLANLVAWYWFSSHREAERQADAVAGAGAYTDTVAESVLLSELSEADMPARKAGTEAAPGTALSVAEGGQQATRRCLLGSLGDRGKAETLRRNLASAEIRADIVALERQAAEDYWVYLPPRGSRQEADALLAELRSQGVDSFLIEEGDMRHGISLGIFSRRENARNLRNRARDEGYDARWRPLPRMVEDFWLELDQAAWRRLRSESPAWLEEPEWVNMEKSCQMVASGEDIQ